MQTTFRSICEMSPGPVWQAVFAELWPSYQQWFLKEGESSRPGYMSCRAALRRHMPELVPTWELLVSLAGGGDYAARCLSLYCPTPYLTGCSQAVWSRGGRALLIRNYDYRPSLLEGNVLLSAWNGVKTLVQADCLWGALDGMNEHGLAVSLAFGGRPNVGEGFGIPLVLRYVLETCRDCESATAVLARVPTNMSYNVSVADAAGNWLTAQLAPDRPAQFTTLPAATNHQAGVEWTRYAQAVSTEQRLQLLARHIADPVEDENNFIGRFLQPPLFSQSYARSFGTLYTAIYNPREGVVDYVWKNQSLRQSFDGFQEGTLTVHYEEAGIPAVKAS